MKPIHLILFVFLTCSIASFAQTQKAPALEIQGEASLKVKPDLAVVTISFNAINMVFNKAVQDVNSKNETLLKQLEKSGFKKEEIKSSSFTAGKNIIWSRDRSIDSGYVASQTVILEFSYNKERVTKLVDSFSESTIGLEFNFDFILSQAKIKEVKHKLIELCIIDAKEKAEIIARTSLIKLNAIQSIQYGAYEDPGRPQPMYKAMEASNANQANGFGGLNVTDIQMEDRLTISWTIAQ
jgi:uncharacterized protein YggE